MPIRKIKSPKNFQLCRTCEHYFISHMVKSDGTIFCQWMNSSFYPNSCKCKEFLPKDNLEFLEWEYGKLDKKFSN